MRIIEGVEISGMETFNLRLNDDDVTGAVESNQKITQETFFNLVRSSCESFDPNDKPIFVPRAMSTF